VKKLIGIKKLGKNYFALKQFEIRFCPVNDVHDDVAELILTNLFQLRLKTRHCKGIL
jgi:hypothetical protein